MLANLAIFMQITSPEMGLTCCGDFGDFYANYIPRDGSNVLANLANLAIFIIIYKRADEFDDFGDFNYIMSVGRAERYFSFVL